MARVDTSSAQESDHRQVWELLPWYVNRTLDAYGRATVEAHLQDCLTCRSELAALRQLEREVRDADPLDDALERSLAATKARIAANTATPAPAEGKPAPAPRTPKNRASAGVQNWFAKLKDSLQSSPMALKGALVVQSALLLVIGIGVLVTLPHGAELNNNSNFGVLSNDQGVTMAQQPRWQIVFADDTPERRLRTLMHAVSARIVDGPSTTGVYTVVLNPQSADGTSTEQRLATLRSVPDVRFVEPLAGVPQ